MSRTIAVLALWSMASLALAASEGPDLLEAHVNLSNKTTLQRGARLFVNYCLSCHSAQYMRYARMAEDLDLDEEVVENNLMFTTDKIGDTMTVAMPDDEAASWFGIAPPDLSVIARARGADWLYSFLNGFYRDEQRPFGVNNLYFPDTAMPHVLADLQGVQRLDEAAAVGEEEPGHAALELAEAGSMTPDEYQRATRDLVTFLVYMGEPARLVRYRIGFWVIAFLLVLLAATYLMKREYWKDVH